MPFPRTPVTAQVLSRSQGPVHVQPIHFGWRSLSSVALLSAFLAYHSPLYVPFSCDHLLARPSWPASFFSKYRTYQVARLHQPITPQPTCLPARLSAVENSEQTKGIDVFLSELSGERRGLTKKRPTLLRLIISSGLTEYSFERIRPDPLWRALVRPDGVGVAI